MTKLNIQPNDQELEKAVLGAMFYPESLAETLDTLSTDCFFSKKHQTKYSGHDQSKYNKFGQEKEQYDTERCSKEKPEWSHFFKFNG